MSLSSRTLVLLTLERHQDGIWITCLRDRLKQVIIRGTQSVPPNLEIEVWTLESILRDDVLAKMTTCTARHLYGVVNRVSDAAEPPLLKQYVAMLHVLQGVYSVPVFNGPVAFSLCSNKWCHHVLFSKAGLDSPGSRTVYQPKVSAVKQAAQSFSATGQQTGHTVEFLYKPNAGGFGKGIRKLSEHDVLVQHEADTSDSMAMIQQYVPPSAVDAHYRVWFLCGKVLCAVERTVADYDSEFTGACAASCSHTGAESASVPAPKAWYVPTDLSFELEERLLPLLTDGHAGSVEFMIHSVHGEKRQLFYDLNLLSTLPIIEGIINDDSVWSQEFDPWMELAEAVIHLFQQHNA